MARNGTEFGIQVSGLPGEWFTAPAAPVKGLFLPGFHQADAGLDMGEDPLSRKQSDGAVSCWAGAGILSLVGGAPEEALAYSGEMRRICVTQSQDYLMPALGFEGTAVGIDTRKVVQTNIHPRYRHRDRARATAVIRSLAPESCGRPWSASPRRSSGSARSTQFAEKNRPWPW